MIGVIFDGSVIGNRTPTRVFQLIDDRTSLIGVRSTAQQEMWPQPSNCFPATLLLGRKYYYITEAHKPSLEANRLTRIPFSQLFNERGGALLWQDFGREMGFFIGNPEYIIFRLQT